MFFFFYSTVFSQDQKNIVFLGNSLTAGFGVEPSEAYPSLIQNKIDQAGLNFKIINAGISGETTSGGLRRMDWLLKQKIDVLVLELGANDGLRGIPLNLTKENLQAIITKTKEKYPGTKILIAGMEVPPNMGETYTTTFRKIFPDLAKTNGIERIPFLLEGVADKPDLNLSDGIHPKPEGHKIVAETVWKYLKPILQSVK
ncbi:arylesterase [bacterium]|nr:arylesterase [bacterium]